MVEQLVLHFVNKCAFYTKKFCFVYNYAFIKLKKSNIILDSEYVLISLRTHSKQNLKKCFNIKLIPKNNFIPGILYE